MHNQLDAACAIHICIHRFCSMSNMEPDIALEGDPHAKLDAQLEEPTSKDKNRSVGKEKRGSH